MLQYHVAYFLPNLPDKMVVAEVLDFPGVASQGFDLQDARSMIASAREDMAEIYLEQGRALPIPQASMDHQQADLVEKMSLAVGVPTAAHTR